jgi:hypothetical protein
VGICGGGDDDVCSRDDSGDGSVVCGVTKPPTTRCSAVVCNDRLNSSCNGGS